MGLFLDLDNISEELKTKKSKGNGIPFETSKSSLQKLKHYARTSAVSNIYPLSKEEFETDFKLFLSIKRYLTRFINIEDTSKSLNIRFLINYMVILGNCFGVKVVADVFDQIIIQKEGRSIIKTCAVFLSYADSSYMGRETPIDIELLKKLGKL